MGQKVSRVIIALLCVRYFFVRLWRIIFGVAERHEQDVIGRTVVITGANSGLGKQTALEMARRGATVVLACRNQALGKRAVDHIKGQTGSNNLVLMELDLADLDSVRKFAASVQKQFPKIDILINCAGVLDVSGKLEYTKAGHEMHFGVNHLGHFLLTNLLLSNLKCSAPSRIVTVSSTAAALEELDLNDLNFKKNSGKSSYGAFFGTMFGRAYATSKYANNLFSYELGHRLQGTYVTTYSLCPGIVDTDIFRSQSPIRRLFTKILLFLSGLTVEQGAETILYCALSKLCAHETAQCYEFSALHKYANSRNNRDLSKRLWEESEKLVGLKKMD